MLQAYRDLDRFGTEAAQRGLTWLVDHQNEDGGWGGGDSLEQLYGPGLRSSVEETALAVEALLPSPASQHAIDKGLRWLVEAVESDRYLENAPIGFYFAKLWYHEKLYPLTFTVSALGQALSYLPVPQRPAAARLTC